MKMICSGKDFAKLVRDCERINIEKNSCSGCVLDAFCNEDLIEDALEFDLTEDEADGNGSI